MFNDGPSFEVTLLAWYWQGPSFTMVVL